METHFTQQEILLITGTGFLQRPWCEKENSGSRQLTEKEQLEEACWNGLLQEMLPEIVERPSGGKKLYLWEIREASSFLELELGEFPVTTDKYFSIDPYSFLSTKLHN
jgi:hypothetical protein